MALLTEMMLASDEQDTFVTWNGGLTTVILVHNETGLSARAHAKHHDEDIFDPQVGYKIALARATARLQHKLEKRYIRLLG